MFEYKYHSLLHTLDDVLLLHTLDYVLLDHSQLGDHLLFVDYLCQWGFFFFFHLYGELRAHCSVR